jgi:hypothetical protein
MPTIPHQLIDNNRTLFRLRKTFILFKHSEYVLSVHTLSRKKAKIQKDFKKIQINKYLIRHFSSGHDFPKSYSIAPDIRFRAKFIIVYTLRRVPFERPFGSRSSLIVIFAQTQSSRHTEVTNFGKLFINEKYIPCGQISVNVTLVL